MLFIIIIICKSGFFLQNSGSHGADCTVRGEIKEDEYINYITALRFSLTNERSKADRARRAISSFSSFA